MRPTIFNWSSTPKWLLLAIISTFIVACNDNGRDPILGNDRNVGQLPAVTAVTPANNTMNVGLMNPSITAEFTEAVTALAAGDFTVTCASPCTSPTGTVSMNSTNTVATFNLAAPAVLNELTLYTATVHNATSRATGLAMQDPYIW
ncbi:MAG: Ig-like domain-containing protein [Idiomarina sp.]|nr:Ig-like domain-containing protein [Idiomarina sp.]